MLDHFINNSYDEHCAREHSSGNNVVTNQSYIITIFGKSTNLLFR